MRKKHGVTFLARLGKCALRGDHGALNQSFWVEHPRVETSKPSRLLRVPLPRGGNFHLLTNMCDSPLLVLKGIYHHWTYFFCPGALTKWKVSMWSSRRLVSVEGREGWPGDRS